MPVSVEPVVPLRGVTLECVLDASHIREARQQASRARRVLPLSTTTTSRAQPERASTRSMLCFLVEREDQRRDLVEHGQS